MIGHLRKYAVLIIILAVGIVLGLGGVYTAKAKATAIPLSGTSWAVSGTSKLAYSFTLDKKHFKGTIVGHESGTMTFGMDGSFSGDIFSGKWTQKGNNYAVSVEPSSINAFIEDLLSAKGYTGTPTIKSISVKGTVKKGGKITLITKVNGSVAITSPVVVTVTFKESLTMSGTPVEASADIVEGSPQGRAGTFDEMLDDVLESVNEN
jgi:hypothetical protein